QARDKDTGERVWVVVLLDLDPAAVRFGRDKVKVKITAPQQPVLPASAVPGYPPAIELQGLVLVPWVDDGRCRGTGECRARLAYLHIRMAVEGGPDACRHVLLAVVARAEAHRSRTTAGW